MKRIGILIESTESNAYFYETIRALAGSGDVEIFFLQYRGEKPKGLAARLKAKFQTRGLWRALELGFFRLMVGLEYKLLSRLFPRLRKHAETFDISPFQRGETVFITPKFSPSGLVVRFSEEDIAAIKSLNLDLILRGNAPGIFKGGIITAARDGILSFHHGDNRWHRGGPAAFWEVYLRKPSTGFVLQILTEELDGGRILFRGNVPTRRSYTENLVNLFEESYPFLTRILLEYARSGRLPEFEAGAPYGGQVLVGPTLAQSISYTARTQWLFLKFFTERLILKQYKRWGVAYVPGNWTSAILRRGTRIQNPPGRYFADPFLASRDGRTVCFVEDFSFSKKRGWISAVEILDDKRYSILGPVIEEPFHMSFPYLFEHQGGLYMIPETNAANAIRLYKCTEFPLKWEFQKELMTDVRAADTMLFEHEGRWWLLTNIASPGSSDFGSQLHAFYADEPSAETWTPHALNPIVFDSATGRNAGFLRLADGTPVRSRQRQGFDLYGAGFSLARIAELTPSTFREEQIAEVSPDFFPKLQGCHHLFSNGQYTVYDFVRTEGLK